MLGGLTTSRDLSMQNRARVARHSLSGCQRGAQRANAKCNWEEQVPPFNKVRRGI